MATRPAHFEPVCDSDEFIASTLIDLPLPFRVTIFDQSIAIGDALLNQKTIL